MHRALGALTCVLFLTLDIAHATQRFPLLKHFPRDRPYNVTGNTTATNSLTSSPSPILPTVASSSPATSTPFNATVPVKTPVHPTSSNSTLLDNSTTSAPTSSQPSCLGSVTYYNSVPPTVYATITEAFTVTVSATNASLPPPVLITPPVACSATVVPLASNGPLLSIAASSSTDTWLVTDSASSTSKPCAAGVCLPGSASNAPEILTNSPGATESPAASTGSAFTSTVLVTKKTPVSVVVPPTSAPPVYQIPSTTKNPTTTTKSTAAGGSSAPNGGTSKASSVPPVQSQAATTTQIGNIIASIINSPFTPATPATTSIDNVPVQVLPSSVVIGGQIVSIPGTSSKTTLQVNGQTFTVQNSQIIAPGTTYAITPERNQEVATTALPSPVTAGGLTFSVGASQAIISGTTYAIGSGAGSPTVVRIGTESVTIGSDGVILPSTTVEPIKITAAPIAPEIVTAGGMTFTVGPSSVVIAGSTYAIGPGAKSTTITVGSKTISIGNNGIGLASTTIAPEPNFSVVTVGPLTFSVDSSEAILSGTTYRIGKGAPTETTVVGGKTISLGPGGVGLPSTTIPPETGAVPSFTGISQGSAPAMSTSVLLYTSALFLALGAMLY